MATAPRQAAVTTILDTLAKEHARVRSLIDRMLEADGEHAIDVRRELFPIVRARLLAYAAAEEHTLYPAIRGVLGDTLNRGMREHHAIEQLILRLDVLSIEHGRWRAMLASLRRNVDAHVAFEESTIFPRVRAELTSEHLEQLDRTYRAARERFSLGA
jgi:hemerythrin superfamily protein